MTIVKAWRALVAFASRALRLSPVASRQVFMAFPNVQNLDLLDDLLKLTGEVAVDSARYWGMDPRAHGVSIKSSVTQSLYGWAVGFGIQVREMPTRHVLRLRLSSMQAPAGHRPIQMSSTPCWKPPAFAWTASSRRQEPLKR